MRWYKKSTQPLCVALLGLAFMLTSDSKADFTFGEPVNLGPTINSTAAEQ